MKTLITIAITSLTAFILLTGCSSVPRNSEFDVYTQRFLDEGMSRGIKTKLVTISFGNPGRSTLKAVKGVRNAGACFPTSYYGEANIVIDMENWLLSSDIEREMLIFHELAHCVLNKKHTDTGLMSPMLINKKEYLKHRTEFLNDLYRETK